MFSNLIDNLFKNERGKIFVSILLGLGIASLFKRTCIGNNCIIVKTLSPDHIQNNIYRHDDKCYKYKSHSSKCDDNNIEVIT
tara:strand:- start:78 stop:323 length:246 start_codon:yes stop_codon:yes gene_type:complete